MTVILVTLFAFLVPVAIVLLREWRKSKQREAAEGVEAREKGPFPWSGAARAALALLFIAVPVYIFSEQPYSHYAPEEAMLKVAFKHSGERVADCDEAGLVRSEGDRYRKELKDRRQVQMDIAALARCPRQRHPVLLEIYIDGARALDRAYAPTGLKKDMASYIYEEFALSPGSHTIAAHLYNSGGKGASAYSIETSASVEPGGVLVLWFNEKEDSLMLD